MKTIKVLIMLSSYLLAVVGKGTMIYFLKEFWMLVGIVKCFFSFICKEGKLWNWNYVELLNTPNSQNNLTYFSNKTFSGTIFSLCCFSLSYVIEKLNIFWFCATKWNIWRGHVGFWETIIVRNCDFKKNSWYFIGLTINRPIDKSNLD